GCRHGAYVDTGQHALCSLSPELFLELEGDRLLTRPMKGTAPRGRFTAEDDRLAAGLAASVKNRAENVMIVDMMRNDLGRIARPGSVDVSSLWAIERYPTLFQLTSTCEATT
ncbi:MAG: aminodeoxychorismate synthase component 1, partial [Actinobacteria bacterium]|nr:aminodeoxychorismate synthase component 1 [Actinomycetota bacterium]